MRLPPYPKKGQPVEIWARLMINWIRANLITGAIGAELKGSGNGKTLVVRHARNTSMVSAGSNPPFHPSVTGNETDGFEISFEPGHIIGRNPKTGEGIKALSKYLPEIGGLPMTDTPRPHLAIEPGQWVYCFYETSKQGIVESKGGDAAGPVIVVDVADKASTHYIPPDPDDAEGGTEGSYYVPICSFDINEDDQVVLRVFQQSDIEHVPYLWRGMDHEGDGESIAPQFDAEQAAYKFPKVKGNYGMDVVSGDGVIEMEVEAENLEGEGVTIYKEPEGEDADQKLQFKRISEYTGDPQIRVSDQGSSVQIRGNGIAYDPPSAGGVVAAFTASVVDGLITAFDSVGNTASKHVQWFNVNIEWFNEDRDGNPGNEQGVDVTVAGTPVLELWFFRGWVFASAPADFDGGEPIKLYSATPTVIP